MAAIEEGEDDQLQGRRNDLRNTSGTSGGSCGGVEMAVASSLASS